MAITRKPRPLKTIDVEALIARGGSSIADRVRAKVLTRVALRMPSLMVRQIDALLETRPVKISRHTWILEAIQERLVKSL